jgi:tetratricopeptide (TPR) repeat protein
MELVFEDDDLRVVGTRFNSPRAVVTFSSLNEHVKPFGKDFLDRHEVPGIYFVAKWNHWWQPEGCRKGIEAAQVYLAATQPQTVMTYGSSMGGFGAAMASRRLGAQTVLMLAPQFSVDPQKPPHETRWRKEAGQIRFLHDDLAAEISPNARKIVIYDNMSPDQAHAELFGALPNTELFGTPWGGHAIGHFLLQTGMLQDLVLQALEGRLTYAGYRTEVRRRRRKAGNYWHQLGRAAQARRRDWSLGLLRRAAELRPSDAVIQLDYGNALLRARELEAALDVFSQTAELAENSPAPLRGLSITYRGLGRTDDAIASAELALSKRPDSTDLQRVLATALFAGKQYDRALDIITSTLQLEPGNAENARLRDRIRAQIA